MNIVRRRSKYLRSAAARWKRGRCLAHAHRRTLALIAFLSLPQLLVFPPRVVAQGPQYYVAPNGSPAGDGSRERPWDLKTALSGQKIPPGSTIWLRGGTYVGVVRSTLTGTETAPILVRQYAGERAIVSDNRERAGAGTINVSGAWTIYRDFEVTNTTTGRGASRTYRPMGFEVTGPHNKFINLVIHDTGHGLGVWKEDVDAEIYGNIIFNCGTQNELVDQGHGHGIYTQNNDGTKSIRDNVIFNQFGWGLHVWPGPGDVRGYEIEGNVFFNNGILSSPSHYDDNFLISAHTPYHAERIKIIANYTYDFPAAAPGTKFYDAGVCLLCTDPDPHAGADVLLQDNYFVGGSPVAIIGNWQDITVSGNSFVGDKGLIAFAGTKQSGARRVRWEENRYFGAGLDVGDQHHVGFGLENKVLPFSNWTEATGFDRSSTYTGESPTTLKIFIRPNQYEPGRANIIVYNWTRQDRVPVDLGSVLKSGDPYVVQNVQDYLGEPVLSGIYDGKPLSLPMTGLRVAVPVGRSTAPRSTGPDFAVFVVRTAASAAAPSPGRSPASARTAEQPEPITGAEDVSRFAGLFVSANPPAKVRIHLDSGKLVATMLNEPSQPSYTLVPVSPTRFRLEGAPPGFFANFELNRQKVTGLTIQRGPIPAVHLMPQ
jgi:hypothetical protein